LGFFHTTPLPCSKCGLTKIRLSRCGEQKTFQSHQPGRIIEQLFLDVWGLETPNHNNAQLEKTDHPNHLLMPIPAIAKMGTQVVGNKRTNN